MYASQCVHRPASKIEMSTLLSMFFFCDIVAFLSLFSKFFIESLLLIECSVELVLSIVYYAINGLVLISPHQNMREYKTVYYFTILRGLTTFLILHQSYHGFCLLQIVLNPLCRWLGRKITQTN